MSTGRTRLRGGVAAVLLGAATFAALAAESTLPGTLPLRRDETPVAEGGLWTSSLLVLGAAIAAGGYLAWRRAKASSARHRGRGAEPGLVRMSSQALTPQASVHAVAWNGEEFLLACTAQQVTLIARRAAAGSAEEAK